MNKTSLLFVFLAFIGFTSCQNNNDLFVPYNNPEIMYQGRIDTVNQDGARLYWSGTTIKLNFEGKAVYAEFEESTGDNYYNIIVDQDSAFLLKPKKEKKMYKLASGLKPGRHTIEIFKRTEWDRGVSTFYGFEITGNARILTGDILPEKKIEFYGNSITAGYAVEDFSGKDRPSGHFTNNYLSYAYLTAKYFNAQYQFICRSGIGITISWFPQIMPEIYDRIDPNNPQSKWDFSLYTPDIVVVNLFQNDSWLVEKPEHEEFKRVFGTTKPTGEFIIDSYKSFISEIREKYPDAGIICALGNMDITQKGSPWPGYVQQAVDELADENIYTLFMPYKNTPGHPTIAEQEIMAKSLIGFIAQTFGW